VGLGIIRFSFRFSNNEYLPVYPLPLLPGLTNPFCLFSALCFLNQDTFSSP